MTQKLSVSQLLECISELNETDTDLFLNALNYGMHDEWDCGLEKFFEIGFGPPEFKIASKSAMYFARAHENDEIDNEMDRPIDVGPGASGFQGCG